MAYPAPTNGRYLDARVTTASQAELQLMLLDGALRFGRRARQLWVDAGGRAEADRLLGRMLDVVEELVRSVTGGKLAESKRLEEEYAFIFRELSAAKLTGEAEPLDAGLRLLAFQRETWRLACEKCRPQTTPAPNLDFGSAATSGISFHA